MSDLTDTLAWANSMLPPSKHTAKATPWALAYTLIAPPKFGKTTWASDFEDSLLLAFEQGHAFIEAYKMIIDCWDYNVPHKDKPSIYEDSEGLYHASAVQIADVIESSDRFKTVIVDTADMAAKQCLDFHLKKHHLTHPQDWEFGKGHDVCLTMPYRQLFNRILKSGRGVIFITHSNTTDSRFAGQQKSKKESTLPSGVAKFLIPQSDVILHGKFIGRDPVTKRRMRVWETEGSDEVLAGARGVGQQYNLPPRFIINQQAPYQQWLEFFNDPTAAERASEEYDQSTRGTKKVEEEETTQAVPETKRKAISKAK